MNDTDIRLPELLSPAGSPAALEAALEAGADAVYCGGKLFNARMNAHNFGDDEMKWAAEACHAAGARLYVTVNTQLYDRELLPALRFAARLCDIGVDGIIAADIGLCSLIREYIPQLPLHASTQMSGANTAQAVWLSRAGFTRMVCARELSGADVARLCASSPIEIEMFVHGAHCVCVSGQCEFSAMIGRRSGNRGECAQPCRMPYNGGYPLSLKDMSLAGHISELCRAGVASLKIEGRMKAPDYVRGVTSVYRRLLDERRDADKDEMEYLAALFSRGGFTDGYYTGKISQSMLGVRSEGDKAATSALRSGVNSLPAYSPAAKQPVVTDRPGSKLPEKIGLPASGAPVPRGMSAEFTSAAQIPASHGFSLVCLPLSVFTPADAARADCVTLPPVIYDRETEAVLARLRSALRAGIRHVMINNVGQLELIKPLIGPDVVIHGGWRLNVFNSVTLSALCREGVADAVLSPELTLPQARDIKGPKRLTVCGRIPLMICEKPIGKRQLVDRTGARFPVIRLDGRDVVLNSEITYMGDRAGELKKNGVTAPHFIFTDETAEEAVALIKAYEAALSPDFRVRRV